MNDFFAAIEFMQRYPQATGKVGITGFCYGGGVSNAAAVAYPELACAVPFYGRQAPTADVAKIEAPLLLHFAELDTRINEGWPAYEAALKAKDDEKQHQRPERAMRQHLKHRDAAKRMIEDRRQSPGRTDRDHRPEALGPFAHAASPLSGKGWGGSGRRARGGAAPAARKRGSPGIFGHERGGPERIRARAVAGPCVIGFGASPGQRREATLSQFTSLSRKLVR